MDIHDVVISKRAEKQLRKIPIHTVLKLQAWISGVKHDGLTKMRQIPGFNDEALRGNRKGQRSIRLSKGYRAFYVMNDTGVVECVEIIEVNKHEY